MKRVDKHRLTIARALSMTAVVVALLVAVKPAAAQAEAGMEAVAKTMFDEARELMKQGRFAEACPKLRESLRLSAGIGTRFNLAACDEKIGKFASAWVGYLKVAAATRQAGQTKREAVARERAAQIEPRMTRLRIEISEELAPLREELQITRGGQPVSAAQWGVAVPLDAGKYLIEARAPAYKPWSEEIEVVGEGNTVSITVPALEELPPEPEPAPGEAAAIGAGPAPDVLPEPSFSERLAHSPQRIAAVAVGGAGVVALGVAIGFGFVAKASKDEADTHCPQPQKCYDEAFVHLEDAKQAAIVSNVLLGAGAAAVAGGVVLWLTAPKDAQPSSDSARLSLHAAASPSGSALILRGRW